MVSISVPTHTYLKKYALHRANAQNGLIKITSTTSWGITLLKILQKRASWESKLKLNYNDQITFHLSEFHYSREGFFLSKQNIQFFNQSIKDQFEDGLFDFITINVTGNQRTNIEEQIQVYLSFFGITENERTLESLVKAYQRWRNQRNYKLIKV